MIDLHIIERGEIPAGWLDALKAYAAVPDGSQDEMLNALLLRSVLRVQEMADRSIIACTFRLREQEVEGHEVRLYQTIDRVTSVTSGDGHDIGWSRRGKTLTVYEDNVVVEYTTAPLEGDIDELLPVVYQYATALFDGEDSRTLASILSQCR